MLEIGLSSILLEKPGVQKERHEEYITLEVVGGQKKRESGVIVSFIKEYSDQHYKREKVDYENSGSQYWAKNRNDNKECIKMSNLMSTSPNQQEAQKYRQTRNVP